MKLTPGTRMAFFNEHEDLVWLKETHLSDAPQVPPFSSFIMYGNEDCPDAIVLYSQEEPTIMDSPVATYELGPDLQYWMV